MKSPRKGLTWAALLLLGGFLLIVFMEVMERRFAEGGIYPHYASFRSDPLGTSAYYETLEGLAGYSVRRNVTHLNTVDDLDGETTLFMLGYPREELSELRAPKDSPVLEAVSDGGRLVIAMNPELVPEKFRPVKTEEEDDWFERRRQLREKRLREKKADTSDEDTSDQADEKGENAEDEINPDEAEETTFDEEMAERFGALLTDRLGFKLSGLEEFERPEEGWETRRGRSFTAKKEAIVPPMWFSQYRFEASDKAWFPVVKVNGKPVVIERRWGKGSIVLATDSFFVSNEALHREAAPEFLIWLVGDNTKVVFDETIHGTLETGGTMKLIRQYRLHGIFLGMLVFVALWAWRSGATLAPGSGDLEHGLVSGGGVAGQNTGGGLIHLLRRSIPRKDLLDHCVEMWRSSHHREVPEENLKKVDEIVERHRTDPKHFGVVEAFRGITEALRRR